MSALQLADQVWVVGSPETHAAHTSPYDCVQYLLWDGAVGVLVDVGTGLGFHALEKNIRSVCPLTAVAGILVTHYHGDHAGGLAQASRMKAPAYMSPSTAAAVAVGDEELTQVARARRAGIYPSTFSLDAVAEEMIRPQTRPLKLGNFTITPIEADGHCDGHLVYLVQGNGNRMLFSGDVIFADGRISMQAIPDCRLDRYAETVSRLAALDADQLFPGHGRPVLSEAHEHIAVAARSFDRLVPPPNLLS